MLVAMSHSNKRGAPLLPRCEEELGTLRGEQIAKIALEANVPLFSLDELSKKNLLEVIQAAASIAAHNDFDNFEPVKRKNIRLRCVAAMPHLVTGATVLHSLAQIASLLESHGASDDAPGNSYLTSQKAFKVLLCLGRNLYRQRKNRVPVTHQYAEHAMFWNLSSLRKLRTTNAGNKIRVISMH